MDANPIVLDDTAGDVVVVVVEGEHDIYTAPTLRERLDEALGRGGGIVVDLTAATFVDSSVLGALLDARRRAIEAGQGYVVCVGDTVEPGVQRILDITGPRARAAGRCGAATRRSRPRARTNGARRHERRRAPEVLLTMPARAGGRRRRAAGARRAWPTRWTSTPSVLADMKMAVTEACTNVVVHAYDEDAGHARGRDARRRGRA